MSNIMATSNSENLTQLNSAKPLSKEKILENVKQDSKLSEMILELKPCYVLLEKLSLSSLNRKEDVNKGNSEMVVLSNAKEPNKNLFLNNKMQERNLKECNCKYNVNGAQQNSKNKSKDYVNVGEKSKLCRKMYANTKNQSRLMISKNTNALDKFSKLSNILKLYKKNQKKSKHTIKRQLDAKMEKILKFLKESRNSESLPCGSGKVNILKKESTMSVDDVKKTVSSHSIEKKNETRSCSEDLQITVCNKSSGKKSQYLPKRGPPTFFNCTQCLRIFWTNEQFSNHLCAGKRSVGYPCEVCEKILKTATEYAIHVKAHFNV
ncbi:hypothetical protein TNCT_82891 [Trichonephila clavata]|uniref:C2H2-type domain-containing protein n=1 Tax=Trichonephila clavata TaxID=2740835 RepID=A0A8X6GAZ5_TRICU|nr:hypothetical protein TNCT_82891 [Trichonephila clavata]